MPNNHLIKVADETPAPASDYKIISEGNHDAVLAEILYLDPMPKKDNDGNVRTDKHDKPLMQDVYLFIWQIADERHENHNRKLFFQWINATTNDKGNLYHLIKSWVGLDCVQTRTKDRKEAWDLSKLVGRAANIALMHEPKKSDPSQTICKFEHQRAAKPYKGSTKLELENYKRPGKWADREAIVPASSKPRAAKMALPDPPPQVEEPYSPFHDDELPE